MKAPLIDENAIATPTNQSRDWQGVLMSLRLTGFLGGKR
jgi:hypothetical protein